jgi:hypothetical protein
VSSSEAAIIAAASAIGGGLIVALSNFGASWLQARQARKGEVRRALLELWYVVTRIDQLLRLEPEAGKMVRLVNAQMSSKLPVLDHAIGLIRRRWLEPQLDDFAIEMNKALAAATMLAPLKLLPTAPPSQSLPSLVQLPFIGLRNGTLGAILIHPLAEIEEQQASTVDLALREPRRRRG